MKSESEIEYRCNNCGHEGHNTRAVPDVPELVRYHIDSEGMQKCNDGDFVIYGQAAEMLAAKDKEIGHLNSIMELCVPLSSDGNYVFIDGHGDVEIDHGGELRNRAETAEAKLITANTLLICMCGNEIDKHNVGDGHSPVDQYHHSMMQIEGESDKLKEALNRIASQQTLNEIPLDDYDNAAFEDAYDMMIKLARKVLNQND